MPKPPLVAVIGPVEPELLRAFVNHYRGQGIEEFFLAFHFTEQAPESRRAELLTLCRELVGAPTLVSEGPWHEPIHGALRDHLRQRAGTGWQVIADIDEFHGYPRPLPELVAAAENAGRDIIGGLLLDRIAADGSIADWSPKNGLDASYPLGGFLTARLLGGCPTKIVLAHSSVELRLGSHRAPGRQLDHNALIPVHHFKWRKGILEDLQRRVDEHSAGRWHELSPAIRTEAGTMLDHVHEHDGRVDIHDPQLLFSPVSTTATPPGWAETSRQVADTYRNYRRWSRTDLPEARAAYG